MNEFEWLRQMRDLNQPNPPGNDLWSRIDAALDHATLNDSPASIPKRAGRRRHMASLAASIAAMVVLAGGIAWHRHAPQAHQPWVAADKPVAGMEPWAPHDPRLAGAALELDAARMELQQAMQQAPDSPALQRLLQQTDAQQTRLRELEKRAG